MARENQGLQIALIIFVFLTLILGVTTFLFQRQAAEKTAAAADAQGKATEAKNTADKIQGDFNTMKGYVGFATTEGIDAIGEQFRIDMDQYAANLPEPQRSYQAALKDLAATVQAKNESLASAEDANKLLQERIQQLEQSKAPLVAQEKQRADSAAAQLAKATKDYNDARTTLSDQAQKQLGGFKQRVGEQDQQRSTLEAEIAQHQARIEKLRQQLATANVKIKDILDPTFEQADGKIRWVNQGNQTVWIDLGSADALQKLTSFSVYPADTNDVTKVGKKGSIEVTQVLEDHLAEARIVDDEPANPIMPGDVIHTPVWAPGEREHFALTDGMDLDGDKKSDLDTVLRIITLNGGVVDTYITDEGELHGKFTNETRYLVLGAAPDETSSPERLKARNDFLTDARGRAITEIQLKDLLNKMGWKNQAPVIRFGRGANPDDFRALPPEGGPKESTGTVSPLFQPRQPPRASASGAY